MGGIAKDLEAIARSFRSGERSANRVTPQSQLEHEIAMLSERLDRLRTIQEQQRRSLLQEECKLDTCLMSLESYNPRNYVYRFAARDKLKKRLFDLERERRRMTIDHERAAAELQDRLFGLLKQRAWLGEAER